MAQRVTTLVSAIDADDTSMQVQLNTSSQILVVRLKMLKLMQHCVKLVMSISTISMQPWMDQGVIH